MSDEKPMDVGKVWWFWFSTNAFAVDKSLRQIFRLLPQDPRCKFCNAPFRGVGGLIMRVLFRKQRSELNPRFCNLCELASREFPGGAEVGMSMLFADICGSAALSEKMSPMEFSQLINRFYTQSTRVIAEEDGLVEKLAGIGVHSGIVFFGAMGTADGLTNISAIGDEVNPAARLASKAAAGEIVVSEQALKKAGINGSELESRTLELKGISQPVAARVMHSS